MIPITPQPLTSRTASQLHHSSGNKMNNVLLLLGAHDWLPTCCYVLAVTACCTAGVLPSQNASTAAVVA